MLVHRWQAPGLPSRQLFHRLLEQEGLEPFEERLPAGAKISDHRHPFGEVRIVTEGEMLLTVAGNQVLLRQGDRIEVPANTRHAHAAQGPQDCVCICAHRIA